MSMPSYVANAEGQFIESLYQFYKQNPEAVDASWGKFFEGFEFAMNTANGAVSDDHLLKELRVYSLIEGYRKRGHLLSTTNPIRKRRDRHPNLELAEKSLSEEDLHSRFMVGKLIGMEFETLESIHSQLIKLYAGNIGIEFKHIREVDESEWLREKFESRADDFGFSLEKKRIILEKLNQSVIFEKFLGMKYVGQKRFHLKVERTRSPL